MTIKSILAAFSGDPASCSALEFATRLQRSHGAHLTGVVWHGPGAVEGRHRRYLSRGLTTMLSERDAAAADRVRGDFETRIAVTGIPERSAFVNLHSVEEFSLPERARAYDIVVMSRHAAELGREMYWARPDVVALRSGRPIITVPDEYSSTEARLHVLVAWDGKRAAARALGDTLHCFATIERITILSVARQEEPAPEAGDDVLALVARHGIEARRITRPAGRGGIVGTISAACSELGAGLLVMGAYEHSKFTEDLLGGVTRDILAQAPVPVLMSH